MSWDRQVAAQCLFVSLQISLNSTITAFCSDCIWSGFMWLDLTELQSCTWKSLFIPIWKSIGIWQLQEPWKTLLFKCDLLLPPLCFLSQCFSILTVGFFCTALPRNHLYIRVVSSSLHLLLCCLSFCRRHSHCAREPQNYFTALQRKCYKPSLPVWRQSTRLWSNGNAFMNWITAVLRENSRTCWFGRKCHRFLLQYCKHSLFSHWSLCVVVQTPLAAKRRTIV